MYGECGKGETISVKPNHIDRIRRKKRNIPITEAAGLHTLIEQPDTAQRTHIHTPEKTRAESESTERDNNNTQWTELNGNEK